MSHLIKAAVFIAAIAAGPAAYAQGVSTARPSDSEKLSTGRSVSVSPACCNPAAHAGESIAPLPPGVYVGMPLKPHDLGYDGPKKTER